MQKSAPLTSDVRDAALPGTLKKAVDSDYFTVVLFALAYLILHLIAIRGYGWFRDELYYIACSDRLALGYVDQPPLSLVLLRIVRLLLGDSLVALRLLPALAGAMVICLTGRLALELGGGRFAAFLAAAAAFSVPGSHFIFSFYSMNFIDYLFWPLLMLIVLRIIKSGNQKLWLLFGLTAGLGLMNKISVLFLGFSLVAALVLTPERRQFRSRRLWLGAGIALLLFLPYILWNSAHGWPTLEFMHNARAYKMTRVTPLGFFAGQLLFTNPVNALIWMPGLFFLFFAKKAHPYRLFGWMFLTVYILLTVTSGKDYYLAGAYPVLFAAGGLFWESLLRRKRHLVLRTSLAAVPVISGLLLCPIALPILPQETLISWIGTLGINYQSGERHKQGVLPQHFADMHGWRELAETVAGVYSTLSPEEKADCVIYMRNYGEAGAIDFFGKEWGLPAAICPHNNYWIWGPRAWPAPTAIILGVSDDPEMSRRDLADHFASVEYAATFSCRYCMPFENNKPIFICRGPRGIVTDVKAFWEHEKHFR
ncbi:glycosyltransferase family 39 protein [bacterium]|nr:glycosyltransferase family 39 protein [bacterium]